MKDKELKLEEVESPQTLCGSVQGGVVRVEGEEIYLLSLHREQPLHLDTTSLQKKDTIIKFCLSGTCWVFYFSASLTFLLIT